jgi:hypothetical protein
MLEIASRKETWEDRCTHETWKHNFVGSSSRDLWQKSMPSYFWYPSYRSHWLVVRFPIEAGICLAYLALKIKRKAYEITMLYVCVCPVNDFWTNW